MKKKLKNLVKKVEKLAKKIKKKHIIASAFILALAFAIALGAYAFRGAFLDSETNQEDNAPQDIEVAIDEIRHPLTGIVLDEAIDEPQVFGVMIDHSVDAWPQAGIDRAFLVIEAPVEAGIPRLLAFFSEEEEIKKIGPVRSARPYFVDWNNELDALYAHVGGSNAALDLIKTNGTDDLNQFWNGNIFWRSSSRYAPHNVYTSSKLLNSVIEFDKENGNYKDPVYDSWSFKDGNGQDEGEGITVEFAPPTYRVKWVYENETNSYKRMQNRSNYKLEGVSEVFANNVLIVVTDMEVIDNVGRREIKTLGSGKAFILQDGNIIEGVWKDSSESDRLRFYTDDDVEIKMNAGNSWIQVVESEDMIIRESE